MSASAERSRTAAAKRDFARAQLKKDLSSSKVHKLIKKKFGSGLASRDMINIKRDLGQLPLITAPRPRPSAYMAKLEKQPDDADKALAMVPRVPEASKMRRFVLHGDTGILAEGVQFSDGKMLFNKAGFLIEWLDT